MNKPVFRVIIAGSREFTDYNLLCKYCDFVLKDIKKTHDIWVLTGGAPGADTLGLEYANDEKNDFIKVADACPANWRPFKHVPDYIDRSAGIKRNKYMADNADALIAF